MFLNRHCSPLKKNNKVSCLDHHLLKKVAVILNKYDYGIRLYTGKKKLHDEISNKIYQETKCDKESCWKDIRIIINELKYDSIVFSLSADTSEDITHDENMNLVVKYLDKIS